MVQYYKYCINYTRHRKNRKNKYQFKILEKLEDVCYNERCKAVYIFPKSAKSKNYTERTITYETM